jgi:hypothetical protein
MSFADYLEDKLLSHTFGATTFTPPATTYVGLSTTTPTDAGGNITEPSGNGYARVAKTNNTTNWPASSGGTSSNGTSVQFPTATGSWGTVTHFFIADASSGGNILGIGALTTSKTIDNGDTASFAATTLTITLD